MKKYTFSQLQQHYAAKRGFIQFSDMKSHLQTSAKNQINELYDLIWNHKPSWGFTGSELQFTTVPAYTTGTISGTAGGRTLTGSSTSWPSAVNGIPLRGQYIVINDQKYKILKVVSTTSIMIEGQLVTDIAAGSVYAIYFVEYPVRLDVGGLKGEIINTDPAMYRPKSIIAVDNTVGVPEVVYNAGVQQFDYASFTGTLTNASNEITAISGVTLDDTLVGKAITINTSFDIYYIIDISGTKIFLDRVFQGATAAAATILINPRGTPMIGVSPYPTGRNLIRVEYSYIPPKLVGDNDYSHLPSDVPLLVGVELLGTEWKDVGDGNINETIFADKRFKESLKVLNSRNVPLQNRIYTLGEVNQKFPRNSNPWNRS